MSLGIVMCDDRSPRERRFDGLVHHVTDMRRPHDPLAVGGDIAEHSFQDPHLVDNVCR